MGMMDYALSGAVKGGADTFLNIREEEREDSRTQAGEKRADKRQIESEKRGEKRLIDAEGRAEGYAIQSENRGELRAVAAEGRAEEAEGRGEQRRMKIWEIQQKRLAEIGRAEFDYQDEAATEKTYMQRQYDTEQESLNRAHESEEAEKARDDANRNTVLSPGSHLVDASEEGAATARYVTPHKPAGGSDGTMSAKDASKFFAANAKSYYGQLDKSGVYSFGTDEQAALAARAAAIADRMWQKHMGKVDVNTIFAKTFQHIRDQKAELNPEAIEDELESLDSDWWLTDEQETQQEYLEGDLADTKHKITSDLALPEEEAAGGEGMMSRNTESSDEPNGTAIDLDPAIISQLQEGKTYGLTQGPYKGRRIQLIGGKVILVK